MSLHNRGFRIGRSFPFLIGLLALLGASPSLGLYHNEYPVNLDCDKCHTMASTLVEDNTSYLRLNVRSGYDIKQITGGPFPAMVGCTFCHWNEAGNPTQMRNALEQFNGKLSQHPVDRDYSLDSPTSRNVTLGSNTNTTRYMSNWDNSWVRPASQLDCAQCHDVTNAGYTSSNPTHKQGYPNHPDNTSAARLANPKMLRGGASSWDNGHASNSFCLSLCHSGTAQGTSGYRMGHYGWGAFDNAGTLGQLKEHSGTPLKKQKCVDCHETHYASTQRNLFGEVGETSRISPSQSFNYVDPANCTTLCHDDTDFNARGHGTTTANQCSSCHVTSGTHRTPGSLQSILRLNAAVDNNMATLALPASFGSNGLDDDYDGIIDDADEMNLRLSAESRCSVTCHTNKRVHQGEIGGTSGSASCLHCHDAHGKGVDNNARMVRRTVMGKETLYWSTADFFRTDNSATRASICDNPSCHAKPLGNTSTPGTILGDVQEHIDANVGPGTVCTSCHSHSSTTGGSSFAPVCNSCHSYPGQQYITGTRLLGGAHTKHAGTDNTGGYAFSCATCHYKYNHNQSGLTPGQSWSVANSNINIKFDGSWNPKNGNGPLYAGAAADNTLGDNVYAPGVGGTGTCAGLTCHGNNADLAAAWPAGSNTTPSWNDNATGACGTCHRATASNPPLTNAHRMHADNNLSFGYGISCRKCHYQTTSTGNTITSRGSHVNRESRVSFDSTDALVSSGTYSGTLTVGDSGTTTGRCANVYCHSPGNRLTPSFDNGALGQPDWKTAGPLACNACHGQAGQTGLAFGMPAYPNGTPKINSHDKHIRDKFACRVCHWTTSQTDNTVTNRANHVNGVYNVVNDNLARHAFTYAQPNCSAAVCHGGFDSGPNRPAWGGGAIGCDVCHMNTGGSPATADMDQYVYDNGMAKIRASEWNDPSNGTGHGRTTGSYPSGNPVPGGTFAASCTSYCHTGSVGHDNAVNPFRLRTAGGVLDFSDSGTDPGSQQNENVVCLDCHSATGANSGLATVRVEQNHYGLKHNSGVEGGTFCFDCHDPHGDANHYMIHDNVTRTSDGVYGIPVSIGRVTFDNTNLNGEAYNSVKDWGDYVDSSGPTPYTGVCQACHTDPAGTSGGTTGGAEYFSQTRFTSTHNKQVGVQGERCTNCHSHGTDFTPSCNSCHGSAGSGSGAPPNSPSSGSIVWSASVDRIGNAASQGLHRVVAADNVMRTSHDAFTCQTCHTSTPGSGATHQDNGANATMTALLARKWTNGIDNTTWNPRTDGKTGSVVDDSCNNVDCHSPYGAYQATRPSGTPFPYERYWENYTRWDCYTCHGYKDVPDATNNPGALARHVSTGSHVRHIRTAANGGMDFDCSRCHETGNAARYSASAPAGDNTYPGTHRGGYVDWNFAGSPNPYGVAAASRTYSGSQLGGIAPYSPTDNDTGAAHRGYGSCANLYCHSIGQSGTGGALTVDNTSQYRLARWDNTFGGKCGDCHGGDGATDNTASVIASAAHTKHVGTSGSLKYPCAACHNGLGRGASTHVDNGINLAFGSVGSVSLAPTVYSQGLSHIVGNGFGTCTVNYCHGTGTPALTGGANQAGSPNVPRWDNAASSLCGSCHGGPAGSTNYPGKASNWPASGFHARHVSDNTVGPNPSLACTDCHTGNNDNTHADGKVDFKTAWNDNAATTKALTQVCNPCHGTGVSDAKNQWDNTAYALACLTCHGQTAAYTFANGTGRVAPNMAGDDSNYGANVRGHNRTGTNYPASGNPPASRTCTECHKITLQHINNVNDNSYGGNRLQDNVNGQTGITTVSGMCAACHTTTGASPATKKNINTHGNSTASASFKTGNTHDPNAEDFAYNCHACHEAHGLTNNGRTGTSANIYMVKASIQVRNYSFPTTGADNTTTTGPVYFESLSGDYSFDDNVQPAANRFCVTCHQSGSRPGSATAMANFGGAHAGLDVYGTDERRNDCSSCHTHNLDDDNATIDGLMPQACNACHSFPGLDNASSPRQMSAGHWDHAGRPGAGGTANSRQYSCDLCHYNKQHNQLMVQAGNPWTGYNPATMLNIRFEGTWNPSNANGPRYNGVNAGVSDNAFGNGGTGACAGIYCHGNSSTQSTWGGTTTATPPKWDNTVAVSCGSCHDTGTADATPGTVLSTKNHPAHLSAAYGPGLSAFTGTGTCSDGIGCHTRYGLSPATTHVNNARDLRSTASDNGYVASALAATQVCRNCHSTYASSAGVGDTLVRTQANWDNTAYKAPCITCHNSAAAASTPPASQGRQNIDGSGDRAPDVEAAWAGNGHGAASIDNAATTTDSGNVDQVPPVRCETCHDEAGQHIGTAKDSTNPWRLDNTLTNYTQTGGLDRFCLTQCHSQTALQPRHGRIVNGTWGVPKDNALHTHPTTMQLVPLPGAPAGETVDKSRWFQVLPDPVMPVGGTTASPLAGDLTTKTPAARTAGTLLVCVTCHDPHGVPAATLATRTFSGTNTEASNKKMLRYNYSGAGAGVTPLCAKCHK